MTRVLVLSAGLRLEVGGWRGAPFYGSNIASVISGEWGLRLVAWRRSRVTKSGGRLVQFRRSPDCKSGPNDSGPDCEFRNKKACSVPYEGVFSLGRCHIGGFLDRSLKATGEKLVIDTL